ncbi:MAG: VWA domain-containing protein [Bdellovibrionota bacterium]
MQSLLREKWLRIVVEDASGTLSKYLSLSPEQADELFVWAERFDTSRRAALFFLERAPLVRAAHGAEGLSRWAAWGLEALRLSSDLSVRVLEAGRTVLTELEEDAAEAWLRTGLSLAQGAERAGWAYFEGTVPVIEQGVLPEAWGGAALSFFEGDWQARQLASEFLEKTARFAGRLGRESLLVLADSCARLARRHGPLASQWLSEGAELLDATDPSSRPALLLLLSATARSAPPLVPEMGRLGARLLARGLPAAPEALRVCAALASEDAEEALSLVRSVPEILASFGSTVAWDMAVELVGESRRLAGRNSRAGAALFSSLPELKRLSSLQEIRRWIAEGERQYPALDAGAVAYFSLASRAARAQLAAFSQGVPYSEIAREMRLFAQGLTGKEIPLSVLPPVGESMPRFPSTDGRSLLLPELFFGFGGREENHRAARLATAHQAGFFEFGTFLFDSRRLSSKRSALCDLSRFEPPVGESGSLSWFFGRFPWEALAREFFSAFEGYRIDRKLQRTYAGLSSEVEWFWKEELPRRPDLKDVIGKGALPLACELLVRRSLGAQSLPKELVLAATSEQADESLVRLELEQLWDHLGSFFATLDREEAQVEDSAQRTAELYELASLFLGSSPRLGALLSEEGPSGLETSPAAGLPDFPESIRASHEPAAPVAHRGTTDPAAAQEVFSGERALGEIESALAADGVDPYKLSEAELADLLAHFPDLLERIEAGEVGEGGVQVPIPEGAHGLLEETKKTPEEESALRRRVARRLSRVAEGEGREDLYLYDEWDYLLNDYRSSWCVVREQVAEEEEPSAMERVLSESAQILRQVIQHFERVRPELIRRERAQADGDEIDLSRVLEALADRRRGGPWPERLYERREKAERNVATLLLIDMSASTGEKIPEKGEEAKESAAPVPERDEIVTRWDPLPPSPKQVPTGRSVLDIQKEALLVMSQAMDYLGDAYAIYGFSGHGRSRVELVRIKNFREHHPSRILRRVAGIRPRQSTRMGAAIRHATRLLSQEEARYKSLILISDGYPQDLDYGEDRRDENYALQDTRAALSECEAAGVHPFCVTVDKAGYDYLKRMCPHERYLVIDDVADLPKVLPRVYRRLTW